MGVSRTLGTDKVTLDATLDSADALRLGLVQRSTRQRSTSPKDPPMFDITRTFTVTGNDFEVDVLSEYMVEFAGKRSLNLTVVSNEKFDDNSPYEEPIHDEHTVWTREIRVRGSRRSMRAYRRFLKENIAEAQMVTA